MRKSYGRGDALVRAVDDVDLDVATGETVAIMGPSGCGKSTLLHLLGGLDRPDSGQITLAGRHVDVLGERGLARMRRDAAGVVFRAWPRRPGRGRTATGGLRRVVRAPERERHPARCLLPGQDAIRAAMAAAFAGPLKNTRRSHQVRSIGFTGPGTAIVITDSVTVPLCCGQRTARPLNHFLAHKRSRRRRRTHGHHAPAAAESR